MPQSTLLLRCALVSTLALLTTTGPPAAAAPAPFPRAVVSLPIPLTRNVLVGDWVMYWGDTRSVITLSESGSYTCRWGALTYVGSWGVDPEGRFWITESSQPQEARSWLSYAVRMKPGTLTGKIEVGSPGVAFRLEKVRVRSASLGGTVLTSTKVGGR